MLLKQVYYRKNTSWSLFSNYALGDFSHWDGGATVNGTGLLLCERTGTQWANLRTPKALVVSALKIRTEATEIGATGRILGT